MCIKYLSFGFGTIGTGLGIFNTIHLYNKTKRENNKEIFNSCIKVKPSDIYGNDTFHEPNFYKKITIERIKSKKDNYLNILELAKIFIEFEEKHIKFYGNSVKNKFEDLHAISLEIRKKNDNFYSILGFALHSNDEFGSINQVEVDKYYTKNEKEFIVFIEKYFEFYKSIFNHLI